MGGSLFEGGARVLIGPAGAISVITLLPEIGVRAVSQEPLEEGDFGEHFRQEDGTVEAWCIYGPAIADQKFEEGKLLIRGRGKNIFRSLADDRRASGEEVACDVDAAGAEGDNKSMVEERACAGWGLGGDHGLNGGKGAVLACGFECGNIVVLQNNGFDLIRTDGKFIVDRVGCCHGLPQGLRRCAVAITVGILRAGTPHCLLLPILGCLFLQTLAARVSHKTLLKLLLM